MVALDEDDWLLVRIAFFVLASIATIACVYNSLLLYTTIVSKNLRSSCNILIGCCALFDLCFNLGELVQFPQIVFQFYIDNDLCCALQLISELGLSAGAACALFLGVDRLISFIFIVDYHRISPKLILIHLLGIVIYCTYTPYLMYAYFIQQPVICTVTSVFHGEAAKLWSYAVYSANLLSVIVYVLGWLAIRQRKTVSLYNRRMFRSLCAAMAVETIGWTTASGTFILIQTMEMKGGTRFALGYVCGIPVNAALAMKTLIYYRISSEYRIAIRRVLGNNDVTNIGSTTQ